MVLNPILKCRLRRATQRAIRTTHTANTLNPVTVVAVIKPNPDGGWDWQVSYQHHPGIFRGPCILTGGLWWSKLSEAYDGSVHNHVRSKLEAEDQVRYVHHLFDESNWIAQRRLDIAQAAKEAMPA
jgi:hypothetical protein